MSYTIKRDKNFINFFADGKNKPYVFDINTGILYSLQSKPLKNLPSGFRECLRKNESKDVVIRLMRRIVDSIYSNFTVSEFSEHADLLMLADKLNSLGYKASNGDIRIDFLRKVQECFKDFVKSFNQNNGLTIYDFIYNEYPIIWGRKHNIELNEIFTVPFINELINQNYDEKKLNYIISVMRRGVGFYYIYDNDDMRIDTYTLINKFNDYFNMCAVLNIPYEKDFFRGYINAKRMYLVNKENYDNKAIIQNYEDKNLFFENDTFTVVIPQTAEDFKNEAMQQHNCVYSIYLRRVIEHRTNVVFIRRKNDIEKSFITCEVNNRGRIVQYLRQYNYSVSPGTEEYDFYKKYKKWLEENWA